VEELGEDIECTDLVLGRRCQVGADGGEPLGPGEALEAAAHLGVDYPALGVMASTWRLSGGSFETVHVVLEAVDDSIMTANLAVPSALLGIVAKRADISQLSFDCG